jgi:hypothetical protein
VASHSQPRQCSIDREMRVSHFKLPLSTWPRSCFSARRAIWMPLVARDELAGTGTERRALRRVSLSNRPPLPAVEGEGAGEGAGVRQGRSMREGTAAVHLRRRGRISTRAWRRSWAGHVPSAHLLRVCDEQREPLARAR